MKAWNELHLGWKDQTFTGDICGWWRGKERKIPQFDSILGHLCLVDEKKQEGSAVVLSPQETSDYWCFHKVVVFMSFYSDICVWKIPHPQQEPIPREPRQGDAAD